MSSLLFLSCCDSLSLVYLSPGAAFFSSIVTLCRVSLAPPLSWVFHSVLDCLISGVCLTQTAGSSVSVNVLSESFHEAASSRPSLNPSYESTSRPHLLILFHFERTESSNHDWLQFHGGKTSAHGAPPFGNTMSNRPGTTPGSRHLEDVNASKQNKQTNKHADWRLKIKRVD